MCDCSESEPSSNSPPTSKGVAASAGSIVPPGVPLASAVLVTVASEASTAEPLTAPADGPSPAPPLKPCKLDFRNGCYSLTFRPAGSAVSYEGTLRVDRKAPDAGSDNIIVSGDLYRKSQVPTSLVVPRNLAEPRGRAGRLTSESATASVAAVASTVGTGPSPVAIGKPVIPIFPRDRYHSYLKVTSVTVPTVVPSPALCRVTLIAEQYDYSQPPAGQFKGTFPNSPSRTVTIRLMSAPAPFPFSLTGGPYYEGRLFEGGVNKGRVTLAWVSRYFRRATVEIDTLTGAVAPAPVPEGTGSAYFDTIFAKTGWQLKIIRDQINIPVPSGVVPTNCWSSADLHNLMTSVRSASTDLDKDWRLHLSVVPAKLGCGRGVMFDVIDVPREACSSFCDDGYPTSDSSNFGAAANKKQRDVPRAFLRSATHEITHTLNQIHQEQETTADNSIMTTTPSVADVLGGPGTGEPGVFPDQINLAHNTTVRHHLNHMPDPVIRPGGWPFASWFPSGAPQASDRHLFDASELELSVTCSTDTVSLGQPVDLSWTLTNRSGVALVAPNDVSTEGLFASITVTDGDGRDRAVRPFMIVCEKSKLEPLEPGDSVSASSKVFWSSAGFAFERPGRYRVSVLVSWSAQGLPVGVKGAVDLFVDYPSNAADNRAAGLVMHADVGKWVALGGGAYHIKEAARRLYALWDTATASDLAPGLLRGFDGLMPDRNRVARMYPDVVAGAGAPGAAGPRPRSPRRRGKGGKGRRR